MAKYVKADDFMDYLYDEVEKNGVTDPYAAAENALSMLDEEDAELIQYARWEYDWDGVYHCTDCQGKVKVPEDALGRPTFPRCPWCGAHMSEEVCRIESE